MLDPTKIESFSNLAAQYGPFFFAVLFIVFVPVIGQAWFAATLKSKMKDPEQKQQAIAVYRFYWVSGIVAGLLLVAISIGWWGYVQMNYVLPIQQATFESKINETLNKRIFEGTIRNVSPNDMFLNDFSSPDYKLYFYPVLTFPPIIRFAIIFRDTPKDTPVVAFDYIEKKRYEEATKTNTGGEVQRVKLCLANGARELFVIRDSPSSIRFDIQCDQGRR